VFIVYFCIMQPQFIKVASFQYSAEALILKGRLEAEGMEVFLKNNNTIDADPLMSNAVGGVQLFVRAEDAEKAEEVLQTISRYAVDNSGNPMRCPNCAATEVEVMSTVRNSKGFLGFLFGTLLLGTLPPFVKYKYHCNNCGHEFEMK
jgi:Putative prokaryotic signal transducing protein